MSRPGTRRMAVLGVLSALALLFSIGAALLTGHHRLERMHRDGAIHNRLEESQNLLPLLQARSRPRNLVRERLAAAVAPAFRQRPFDQPLARLLKARIQREFGENARFMVWDPSLRPLAWYGFPPQDRIRLSQAMGVVLRGERIGNTDPGGVEQLLRPLFSPLLHWGKRSNRISMPETNHHGEPGLFLFGCFMPPSRPNADYREFLDPERRSYPNPDPHFGSLVVFVPFAPHEHLEWRLSAFGKPIPGIPVTLIPTSLSSLRAAGTLSAGASSHLARSWKGMEGGIATLSASGEPLCLVRPFPDSNRLFLVTGSGNDDCSSTAGRFLLTALGVLCFALLARAIQRTFVSEHPWHLPVLGKFLVLALLASLPPILGLAWMLRSHLEWQESRRHIETVKHLERRLARLDQLGHLAAGELVSKTRMFFEGHDWHLGFPTQKAMDKMLQRLGRHFSMAYLFHRREGYLLIGPPGPPFQYGRDPSKLDKSGKVLPALMDLCREDLRLKSAAEERKQGIDSFKVMLESVLAAAGREALHTMSLQQDTLTTFQLSYEGTWLYRHVKNGILGRPEILFAIALDRKDFQRDLALRLSEDPPSIRRHFPEVALMSHTLAETPVIMPERAGHFPALVDILWRISRDGGMQKARLHLNGSDRFAIARQLQGLDYSALVSAPLGQGSSGTSIPTMLPATLYPLAVICFIALLFSRFYLRPLREVRDGLERMVGGDYGTRLPVRTADEIGALCTSFNHMAEGLQQKEYLSRFLSDLTLAAVKNTEGPPATRLEASVLFSDIRGFTTLSEQIRGEELVAMLNQHITRMEAVIEAEGGTIEKLIGDAIMAVFLPIHGRPLPAERAARAGLTMQREAAAARSEQKREGRMELRIGVGIATGEVLMGVLGSASDRTEFTVIGPTVTRAAAMEKKTKIAMRSGVVICSQSRRLLGPLWPAHALDTDDAWELGDAPHA